MGTNTTPDGGSRSAAKRELGRQTRVGEREKPVRGDGGAAGLSPVGEDELRCSEPSGAHRVVRSDRERD